MQLYIIVSYFCFFFLTRCNIKQHTCIEQAKYINDILIDEKVHPLYHISFSGFSSSDLFQFQIFIFFFRFSDFTDFQICLDFQIFSDLQFFFQVLQIFRICGFFLLFQIFRFVLHPPPPPPLIFSAILFFCFLILVGAYVTKSISTLHSKLHVIFVLSCCY